MSDKDMTIDPRVTGSFRPDETPTDSSDFWALGRSVALLLGAMAAVAWLIN